MKKSLIIAFAFLLVHSGIVSAQSAKPKLVVGLVIDQMRWDYLYRYQELYSAGGFKRLLGQGYSCENTFIPYTPTYTAPGHTCIYTGSVPSVHGIVGNNWFDRNANSSVYCTDDAAVNTIGSKTKAGKMSPRSMWASTIGDELRLSNNFKSKVVAVALKDRSSILPGGHSANAAYWYDDESGKWVSSSYYMQSLPGWVNAINEKDPVSKLMQNDWNTLLPANRYWQSTEDDKVYENNIKGESTVTFPHRLSQVGKEKYAAFKTTPFAIGYTFDFAKEAIEKEQLGRSAFTDFLAISISSTDYIGHDFGPNSIEMEDTYLRLDLYISQFLRYLDSKIGKGKYLLFLSADHGAAHVPGFLNEHRLPAGRFNDDDLKDLLEHRLEKGFGGSRLISSVQNYQVYYNREQLNKLKIDMTAFADSVKSILAEKDFIVSVVETDKLSSASISEPQKTMMINGYNPKRSGDVQFTLRPAYFDRGNKGTTHGLWNPYDAHIPLLFYGWNVHHGKTNRRVYMTDIAASLAAMLQIQMPSGCVGSVIEELLKP